MANVALSLYESQTWGKFTTEWRWKSLPTRDSASISILLLCHNTDTSWESSEYQGNIPLPGLIWRTQNNATPWGLRQVTSKDLQGSSSADFHLCSMQVLLRHCFLSVYKCIKEETHTTSVTTANLPPWPTLPFIRGTGGKISRSQRLLKYLHHYLRILIISLWLFIAWLYDTICLFINRLVPFGA